MFLFSALLKRFRSLSILGIVMKVSRHPHSSSFSCCSSVVMWWWREFFQFSKMTWTFFLFPRFFFFVPHLIRFTTSSSTTCLFLLRIHADAVAADADVWNQCHLSLTGKDTKLYHGEKYLVSEAMINSFTWQMNLTVRNLHKSDFASYVCSSENALGKSDTRIRLQGKKREKRQEN